MSCTLNPLSEKTVLVGYIRERSERVSEDLYGIFERSDFVALEVGPDLYEVVPVKNVGCVYHSCVYIAQIFLASFFGPAGSASGLDPPEAR